MREKKVCNLFLFERSLSNVNERDNCFLVFVLNSMTHCEAGKGQFDLISQYLYSDVDQGLPKLKNNHFGLMGAATSDVNALW